ncbi:MAG: NHLP bacteriocin system secretion protein [Xanthobacteraceae bacterium]
MSLADAELACAPDGDGVTGNQQQIFRAAALERIASPEQLDHLVSITKPFDWIMAFVIVAGLASVLAWGILGRIPTRVTGEGILISSGGRVLDAVSSAAGRLASINVAVGDRVSQGQVVAVIAQTDIEQRHRDAVEVYREREREHSDLVKKIERELATKAQNFAKLEAAFEQIIRATEQRIEYLTVEVKNLEGLLAKGFTTRRNVEDRRRELADAQQRKEDMHNEILKLRAQEFDLETQREREQQESQFRFNEAGRQMAQLAGELGRNTQVASPSDGMVIEVKISPGSVLTIGTPVIAIEAQSSNLDALVYIPPDRGKSVKPGMEVRLEPSTIKREEFGMLVGTIISVSEFPITPQGMVAMLHNETLTNRFSRDGAPYAAIVRLERDDTSASGYRWAVGSGPSVRLTSGTMTRAEITTRKQRPADLVIPVMKRLTGLSG